VQRERRARECPHPVCVKWHLPKWHLGVPLLPADCAGRPCRLCGGPVDIFEDHDHAVS